jgi:hypothetical protein
LKIPYSCNTFHNDKSTEWAIGELKKWLEFSPWRVVK